MKAEQYLLDYMEKSNITIECVQNEIGINMAELANGKGELMADEFIRLCIYLGVDPDDVMHAVV